jgi:hypothetical protein
MKVYLNESEEASRKQIWLRNLLKISDHNSRNLTFVMELNQFADLVSIALIVQSVLVLFTILCYRVRKSYLLCCLLPWI